MRRNENKAKKDGKIYVNLTISIYLVGNNRIFRQNFRNQVILDSQIDASCWKLF